MKVVELKEETPLEQGFRKYFPHAEVRKYQSDIADSVYRSLKEGSRSILLEGPTGLGKGL